MGASPEGDRAFVASPSSPSVSPLRASIPSAKTVGITGSQVGPSQRQKETLCSVLIGLREGGCEWQHNGDCIGVDAYAGSVWRFLGGKVHLHPPTIRTKRAFLEAHKESAPKPYLDRNTDIARDGDILVAIPKEQHEEMRGGTWSTVRRARKLGKPIIFVWPNGCWSIEHPAQGIDARSGETREAGLDPEGTKARSEGCAPKEAP